ncbi:hypothetical protein DPMN_155318 [Dreissena polymorpha]|uniref:Uncharacterized protein n=1 Tax=Dreissena polymorpha TaxID=45954 RepID=A0A9D4FSE2_DREPO|nr:hypothetical protein DPMN_155318 [Dreissena polymorpha]
MSMSELARYMYQLDIRDFCRMSMSELARHLPQLDIRDWCRMSISELARPSSLARYSGLMPNVDVRAG